MHSFWDWLSFEQPSASAQGSTRVPQQVSPGRTRAAKKGQSAAKQGREELLQEQGMKTFLRAFQRHQGQMVEQFTAFLIVAGTDNDVELYMRVLRDSSQNTE